jgi:hypothetical protein
MKALKQRVAFAGEQLGAIGTLALFILCATLAFHALQLKPLEQRLAARVDQLERRGTSAARDTLRVAQAPELGAQLAAFYSFFEREESATDLLVRLYALATDLGVDLRLADYHYQKSKGRIDQYRIAMPVRGNYAQIRAFLENALISIPVLALDHVAFRRNRISEGVVEAEIRVTLYLLAR